MAKKKKEKVVEKSTEETKVNEPKGDITKVQEKMKMKPEDLSQETITKVNLDKPIEDTKEIIKTEDASGVEETPTVEEVIEEPVEQVEETETPVVQEITGEAKQEVEEVADIVGEALTESMETGEALPENIQKLMTFMEETGGDLNDYVTLNQDYSELDNQTLLKEYYKSTKPHLTDDEVDFVMEDTFSYDEDVDEEREIKRKKLAMKEQVAQARQHLDSVKSKYYEDIKAGSKLTGEQQEAIDFFSKHNEESDRNYELNKKQHDVFANKTNNVFNDKFKGFEFNIGEKKFRYNVKDAVKLKETQGDINNFIKKFLTKDNIMEDAAGYHKGLFTAMNPDQVANHFYEQGKADALKESMAKSKNVSMDPRQVHEDNINTSGLKVRALDNDQPDFKFKIKNKNLK